MKMEIRSGKNSFTRLVAGGILLIAALLTLFHSRYWAILTGLIGITHLSSAIFGFCPLERFLHRFFGLPVCGKD